MIEAAFLEVDLDIGVLAGPVRLDERQAELAATHADDVDFVIGDAGGKVAVVLIELLDALLVFLKLGRIEALRKQVLEENRIRNADGAQVLHGPSDYGSAELIVPFESDVADLDLGTFVDLEDDLKRRGRHLMDVGLDSGELAAALRQVLLQHIPGALHLVRIVLRFDAQSHAAFLEPVENFRHSDRLHAVVLDGPHDAPLDHHEADYPTVSPRLALHADIVEAAGIPESHEVAMQRVFVVRVALFGENQSPQSVLRNSARAPKLNRFDHILRRSAGNRGACRWLYGFDFGGLGGGLLGRLRDCLEGIILFLLRGLLLGLRLGRLGLRLRRLLSQHRVRTQHAKDQRAQAAEPGVHHLNRVPFHSAPSKANIAHNPQPIDYAGRDGSLSYTT